MTPSDSTQPSEQPDTRISSPFSSEVRLSRVPELPDPLPQPEQVDFDDPVAMEAMALPPALVSAPPAAPLVLIRPPEAKPLSAYIASPMTPGQAAILDDYSSRIRIGPAANLPMICAGDSCKFYKNCPLVEAKLNLPLGQKCPVETSALDMWRQDFIQAYNVSDKHPQYALMVRLVDQMVGLEALEGRLMWWCAQDPEILKHEVVGFSQQGVPIEADRLNPMLDYILRLKDRKLKMLREMLATPRAEAEARRRLGQDPGSQTAAAASALNGAKPGFVNVTIGKPKPNNG